MYQALASGDLRLSPDRSKSPTGTFGSVMVKATAACSSARSARTIQQRVYGDCHQPPGGDGPHLPSADQLTSFPFTPRQTPTIEVVSFPSQLLCKGISED
ncbi:unnamed protein product [Alopecurus aequalis]